MTASVPVVVVKDDNLWHCFNNQWYDESLS